MHRTDFSSLLAEIHREVQGEIGRGKVADYIPPLAAVSAQHFGMAIRLHDGNIYATGDVDTPFSVQSISKVFLLALALKHKGEQIWSRLNLEPSGTAFNSLVQLEYERGKPRNPFINSGAIVICDILLDVMKQPEEELLSFVRMLANSNDVISDALIAEAEFETGHRNKALAHLVKSFGNLNNEVDRVLRLYYFACALRMNCVQVSQSFSFLANKGIEPISSVQQLTPSLTKRLNAIMLTCGTYDGAGDFVYRVGMPGKSGVGGGIAAIVPDLWSVCVWSPALNEKGNSSAGVLALELLTTKTAHSIF